MLIEADRILPHPVLREARPPATGKPVRVVSGDAFCSFLLNASFLPLAMQLSCQRAGWRASANRKSQGRHFGPWGAARTGMAKPPSRHYGGEGGFVFYSWSQQVLRR